MPHHLFGKDCDTETLGNYLFQVDSILNRMASMAEGYELADLQQHLSGAAGNAMCDLNDWRAAERLMKDARKGATVARAEVADKVWHSLQEAGFRQRGDDDGFGGKDERPFLYKCVDRTGHVVWQCSACAHAHRDCCTQPSQSSQSSQGTRQSPESQEDTQNQWSRIETLSGSPLSRKDRNELRRSFGGSHPHTPDYKNSDYKKSRRQ
eukprot:gnl/TRDRNA2_/TRDRNA2_172820_c2_seq5.p1 gnl/TRDRNA2_/TRDRNA2_172820_c2~~gnl/TRDRNA2_/TRDRNA2_172820_c2_seq5.p1  ORF type:complete len:208 (-),score=18.74 gnl/TRDRNA2_/TRDRNA2_172820_c2_seq5:305-928(-)